MTANASAEAQKAVAEKAAQKAHRKKVRRLFWMTQARIWHWITGAATLVGMLMFAVTGITLNHAGQIEGKPVITEVTRVMPPEVLAQLGEAPRKARRRSCRSPSRTGCRRKPARRSRGARANGRKQKSMSACPSRVATPGCRSTAKPAT